MLRVRRYEREIAGSKILPLLPALRDYCSMARGSVDDCVLGPWWWAAEADFGSAIMREAQMDEERDVIAPCERG